MKCGLGGDAFVVLYDARKREMVAFNGSGVAAAGATAAIARVASVEVPSFRRCIRLIIASPLLLSFLRCCGLAAVLALL